MEASKEIMLDGNEPQCEEDWMKMVNFFAANIEDGLEEIVSLLMVEMYDIPLSEDCVKQIAKFQMDQKKVKA